MPSISQVKSLHLTSILYTTLKASYCLHPTTKTILLQLKCLHFWHLSVITCFSWDSLMCWHHSLVLAWERKTDNCFQVSIPRLSAQPAIQVSPHAYLFISMPNRVLGMVFWYLTHHNTHVDKIITQANLMAQFYIQVIPSLGEDTWMPSSVSPPGICHPFLINQVFSL